jgi:hypothetical protein
VLQSNMRATIYILCYMYHKGIYNKDNIILWHIVLQTGERGGG